MTQFKLPHIARRWRFAAALAGVTALAGGGVLIAAPSNPATASAFHPMVATRVLDTREGTGTPLGELSTIDVLIPGLPDDATAISINVTAVDGTEASYATVYPAGAAVRPTTSTVNWDAAGAVANSATVVVNADHTVRVFNLKGTVNVVIDLLGFYAPSPTAAGPQGIQGIAGPAGPIGPAVFLYANNTIAQGLATGDRVTFDSVDATLGGITATETNSVFTVPTAGVYKVSFGVVGESANQFGIRVNNLAPAEGALVFGSLGQGSSTGGTAVLTLAANNFITLVNRASDGNPPGSGNVVLSDDPWGGTETELNAWIVIEQLS